MGFAAQASYLVLFAPENVHGSMDQLIWHWPHRQRFNIPIDPTMLRTQAITLNEMVVRLSGRTVDADQA
ncbi:hypothetical protein [Mesorhizobium abyssinicae]|uniref:hypothetical protein n=1 Tax=Mesorhizobium abyssinicae TaxID=1209958 RepID=UPI003395D1E6